jgi:DNA-binding transcriptional LysR family regulator
MVSYDEELPIRREIDRVLASGRVQVEVVMAFDNVETIKRAIEIDAGIGLLPEPTVVREVAGGSLTAIPITNGRFVRPVGIIRRRGKELGRTATRFIQLLNERANGAAEPGMEGNSKAEDANGGPRQPSRRSAENATARRSADASRV